MDANSCIMNMKVIEVVPVDNYKDCSEASGVRLNPCEVKAEVDDDCRGKVACDIPNKSCDVVNCGLPGVEQAAIEQAPSQPVGTTPIPFVWYNIPADEVTSVSDKCGQWQDERTALSNTLINGVNENKCDVEGEDDMSHHLLSRHTNDVGSGMLGGHGDAGDVVSVQQRDDSETQSSWDQVTDCSSRMKNPDVQKTYACGVCHETFSSSSFLASPKHSHTGVKPHSCDMCHKSFTYMGNLSKHKRSHTDERPHIFMASDMDDNPHKCDICHKQFTQHSYLKKHMFTHTGERPHACDVCHKQFTLRGTLKKHMLTHTGERPHTCDVCHKQFTRRGDLKTHMLTHTGDKDHINVTYVTGNLL